MSFTDVLTPEAIQSLVHSRSNGTIDDISYNIQAILVEETTTQLDSKKYTINISDGTLCLDCSVVPVLFHLFSNGAVTIYSIITITRLTAPETGDSMKFVLVDLVPLLQCEDVIGEPTYVRFVCKRQLFCDGKPSDAEPVDAVNGVTCENCNSQPCNWTKFGSEIITHLTVNYVGYFMEEDGKVVDKLTETSSAITNHQL